MGRRAEIGRLYRRVGPDPVGHVGRDDLAVDEHGNAVGEIEHDAHVVLDHDEGASLRDRADQVDRRRRFLRVQR